MIKYDNLCISLSECKVLCLIVLYKVLKLLQNLLTWAANFCLPVIRPAADISLRFLTCVGRNVKTRASNWSFIWHPVEKQLWVVTGILCLWFLCDERWCPDPERVLCFSLWRALSGDDWQEQTDLWRLSPCCRSWANCLNVSGPKKWPGALCMKLKTLVGCSTLFHALVSSWWFCLPWCWRHPWSSGPVGEGRPRSPLSTPRSLVDWLKRFVAEQV